MISRIINKIKHILFFFNPPIAKNKKLIHIGTEYGGYVIHDKELEKPVIISCGVGEDISFDIDMINNYGAKIFLVDPTPRSKIYFDVIKKNFGSSGKRKYNETGYIDPKNYDLKKINQNNLTFIEKALWHENNKSLKLYFPKEKKHVSLTVNKHDNLKISEDFIKCITIDYNSILNNFSINEVDILKLDIEGAEIIVLNSILVNAILPKQILVEFDIRRRPNYANKKILENIHEKICKKYELININKKGDFTYTLKQSS